MATSDNDSDMSLGDELLALAGGSDNERRNKKKRSAPSTKSSAIKRRKADFRESDMEPESEDDDSNPYPIEGKYKDEADRLRLLQMPEIEREQILAQRIEESQRLRDRANLDQLVKAQGGATESDSVAKAAKRKHVATGTSKEKSRVLDQLKAKRKEKGERAANRANRDGSRSPSPKKRRRSSSMSDSSDMEDGEVGRDADADDERDKEVASAKPKEETLTLEDLDRVRLTRDMLAKHCMAPWFEDYVKGAFVRYLVGDEKGEPVYRVCEITDLAPELAPKPYKLNDRMVNQLFELKHGAKARVWPMDKVSNSIWTQREFDRLVITLRNEKVPIPTKRALEKKAAQMQKLVSQPLTEKDVTAMLARKAQLQPNRASVQQAHAERARLNQERTLAIKRQDYAEAAAIAKKIEELDAVARKSTPDSAQDALARVNERNRKANLEAIRQIEAAEAERKKRERLERSNGINPNDPNSRLKVPLRKFPISRDGTPSVSRTGSPFPSAVGTPPTSSRSNFEALVVGAIDVDLGDF